MLETKTIETDKLGVGIDKSDVSSESTVNSLQLDEMDLALVNAMQINGRASWSLIGKALGISPATAARRWNRLSQEGIAWVTAYGGPAIWETNCLAFVEVDCVVGSSQSVATTIASHPYAASVEFAAGGANLFVTTVISDLSALSNYVRNRVSALEGVIATRVHLATRVYTEASKWRLRSLSQDQQEVLAPPAPTGESEAQLFAEDHPLLVSLGLDGRKSCADLAKELGVSTSTVRRRLERLVQTDAIRFRCDVASSYTTWPVLVNYQAACPPAEIDFVGRTLSSLPEIRVCAATLDAHNMSFTVWLRSTSSSLALEEELSQRLPQLDIRGRTVTLHSLKRFGRLLDERGRSVGAVPMDMWRAVG